MTWRYPFRACLPLANPAGPSPERTAASMRTGRKERQFPIGVSGVTVAIGHVEPWSGECGNDTGSGCAQMRVPASAGIMGQGSMAGGRRRPYPTVDLALSRAGELLWLAWIGIHGKSAEPAHSQRAERTMKTTMQAMAVAVVGMVLAGEVWGHGNPTTQSGSFDDEIDIALTCSERAVTLEWRTDSHLYTFHERRHGHKGAATLTLSQVLPAAVRVVTRSVRYEVSTPSSVYPATHSGSYTFQGQWNALYRVVVSGLVYFGGPIQSRAVEAACGDRPTTPTTPTTPTAHRHPELATATHQHDDMPDHVHPVERCDHLAIVPAMPRALAGDEDAPDHWLSITNPGAASIRFTIEGRDEAGVKGGTYRRELPGYWNVRVKMRDIEAAFDLTDRAGWWWLKVSGSGPIDVAATMKQGEARRFVTVKVPATCGTGAVTRTRVPVTRTGG